jgi:hypothetical protein
VRGDKKLPDPAGFSSQGFGSRKKRKNKQLKIKIKMGNIRLASILLLIA